MLKVICINGPPQAGKDTLGRIIVEEAMNHHGCAASIMKFAQPIIDVCKSVLGIDQERFDELMQGDKNKPMTELGYDISIRQMMIDFSENFIKPSLGKDWFAVNLARKIRYIYAINSNPSNITIAVTDSGFQYEFDRFKELTKDIAEIKLVRITKHGCNYDNDSREYVNNPDCYISNDGNIAYLNTTWLKLKGETS